jgi:hypothetical protein
MGKSKQPSDLAKGSSPKTSPELTEKELGKVSGGAGDYLLTLGGIKGESSDDTHKETIHVDSFK